MTYLLWDSSGNANLEPNELQGLFPPQGWWSSLFIHSNGLGQALCYKLGKWRWLWPHHWSQGAHSVAVQYNSVWQVSQERQLVLWWLKHTVLAWRDKKVFKEKEIFELNVAWLEVEEGYSSHGEQLVQRHRGGDQDSTTRPPQVVWCGFSRNCVHRRRGWVLKGGQGCCRRGMGTLQKGFKHRDDTVWYVFGKIIPVAEGWMEESK